MAPQKGLMKGVIKVRMSSMLITRSGFKVFNKYDLSAKLEGQLSRLREEVISLAKSGNSVESAALADKYKLISLELDAQELTCETTTADIPAEYFPSPHNFFLEPGNSYQKEVLIFHLPFRGDQNLLHYIPNPRIVWTAEVALEGNEILFEIIQFSDDVDSIRQEKDKVVDNFMKQAGNVNEQIKQYNNKINMVIEDAALQAQSQISKQNNFMAQLGTPTKKKLPASSVGGGGQIIMSSKIGEKPKSYDVFICHASEDKNYVDKLANSLKEIGIAVWYDSFIIQWGDDLRSTIDKGLKASRFGIVVFSKAFFQGKKWTEHELNGLFSKETKGQKVILPIWHDITREDVAQYSLSLADRIAKDSDDIQSIVKELKSLLEMARK